MVGHIDKRTIRMEIKDKDYFCIMPHAHMEIGPHGHARPCCAFNVNSFSEQVKLPNVAKSDVSAIFEKHVLWKSSRNLSRLGKINGGCKQCYAEDAAGLKSYRVNSNNKFLKYIDVENEEHKLISLELKLGAKCNLACRICSSSHSNQLLKEDSYNIFGNINKEWIRDLQSQSDWATDDEWWEKLYDISGNLKHIQFTGGEPLIIDQHFKYLEWLSTNNIDPDISYITNGTVELSEKIKNIWGKFSNVNVTISMDAIGGLGEYIRTNSVWEIQKKNLLEYIDFLGHRNVSVICTVSVLNVHKIKDFIDFFSNIGILDDIGMTFNILTSPEYLNISNLNSGAKEYLNCVYNNIINTNEDKIPKHVINGLKNIKSSIDIEKIKDIDVADGILKKDELYNTVNRHKKHSFSELEPDWFNIIKEGEKC